MSTNNKKPHLRLQMQEYAFEELRLLRSMLSNLITRILAVKGTVIKVKD